MTIGVVGRKTGMTRVFTEEGVSVPVTVVQVEPNRVSQVKTVETDGYQAIQVTVGDRRAQHRVSQPIKGHLSKAEMRMGRGLWEFRVEDLGELAIGAEISVSQFEAGQIVDVTGQSKGKGFAGAVKRWNFRTQDATHGNSLSHRAPGSIGNCQTPGRVFKGKKMAGHMGAERVTVQGLEVVRIDEEKGLILVKGSVPGANGTDVIIKPTAKA
jgi:large subunit ribosomal protein L3